MRRKLFALTVFIMTAFFCVGSVFASSDTDEDVVAFLQKWEEAWESRDLDRYLSFYSKDFDLDAWKARKGVIFAKEKDISVDIFNAECKSYRDKIALTFLQDYSATTFKSVGKKELILQEEKDGLKIISETWAAVDELDSYRTDEELTVDCQAVKSDLPKPVQAKAVKPKTVESFIVAVPEEEAISSKNLPGLWFSFLSSAGDNDLNITGYTYESFGAAIGYDQAIYEDFILGVTGGYIRTEVDSVDGINHTEADDYNIGLYASYMPGNLYVDLGLLYSLGYDLVNVKRGRRGTDTDATTYSVNAEVGYELEVCDRISLIPFVGFYASRVEIDAYRYPAINNSPRNIEEISDDFVASHLGLRADIILKSDLLLKAKAFWIHDFETLDPVYGDYTRAFGAAQNFVAAAEDFIEDRAVLGVGLRFRPSEYFILDLDYDFECGKDFDSHTGLLTLKREF